MKKQLRATEKVFIITLLITFLVCPGFYAAEEMLPTPEEIKAIMKQKQTEEWEKFDGTWKGAVPGPDGNTLIVAVMYSYDERATPLAQY